MSYGTVLGSCFYWIVLKVFAILNALGLKWQVEKCMNLYFLHTAEIPAENYLDIYKTKQKSPKALADKTNNLDVDTLVPFLNAINASVLSWQPR